MNIYRMITPRFLFITIASIVVFFASIIYWIITPIAFPAYREHTQKSVKSTTYPSLFSEKPSFSVSFLDLGAKMRVALIMPRPDRKNLDPRIYLQWLESEEEKIVSEQEKIYISLKDKRGNFSSLPTSYWIEAKILKNGILITSHIEGDFHTQSNAIKNHRIVFPLKTYYNPEKMPPEFALLQNSSYIAPNQLFDPQYHRLKIDNDVVSVKKGDLLYFADQKWQKLSQIEDVSSYSIAQVVHIDDEDMEIEGWERQKEKPYLLHLHSFPKTSIVKDDNVIQSVRLRQKNQVSCFLEGQPIIVKAGDVLEKVHGRWRKIYAKKPHPLAEEFFVADKISKGKFSFSFYDYLCAYPCRKQAKLLTIHKMNNIKSLERK